MKQQLYISKDYLIANTIIGVNKLEGRTVVDDKDIQTVKELFTESINKKGYDVTFNQNTSEDLEEDIFEKQVNNGKVYILLPWSSIDHLIDRYQKELPFSITNTFQEILGNQKLRRNIKNNNLIDSRISELLENKVFAPNNKKVTNTKVKEYYVSQR